MANRCSQCNKFVSASHAGEFPNHTITITVRKSKATKEAGKQHTALPAWYPYKSAEIAKQLQSHIAKPSVRLLNTDNSPYKHPTRHRTKKPASQKLTLSFDSAIDQALDLAKKHIVTHVVIGLTIAGVAGLYKLFDSFNS